MGALWDTIKSLFAVGEVSASEDRTATPSATSSVELASDGDLAEDRQHVWDWALPGFYSCHKAGDVVCVIRTDDGGIALAANTARESDAVEQERCIKRGTMILRLTTKSLPTGGGTVPVVEIKGATGILLGNDGGSVLAVARKSDLVAEDGGVNGMATWLTKVTAVAAAIDPTIVYPTSFGIISGGSTKTFSS